MREIKFRAFYKGERYPIFEGGLEEYEKPRMIYNIQDIYDGSGADDSGNGVGHVSCFGSFLDDEDYIVGQYTGLKDINGVEIYEGDIVEWSDRNFDAAFGNSDGPDWFHRIELIKFIDQGFNVPQGIIRELKVIGNIYENPELLGDNQ